MLEVRRFIPQRMLDLALLNLWGRRYDRKQKDVEMPGMGSSLMNLRTLCQIHGDGGRWRAFPRVLMDETYRKNGLVVTRPVMCKDREIRLGLVSVESIVQANS